MTRLAALEELFWRAVRHTPAPPEIEREIVSTATMSASDRVDLYRRMYWYRQVDALFDGFPVLASVLGTETFTRLACRYIAEHPSEHPMLEWLGRKLPSFMRERAGDLVAEGSPLWADVAEIEWAQARALLAPNPARVLRFDELPLETFAATRLELSPSVVTCRARRGALDIVRRISRDRSSPISPLAELGEPRSVLVWRPDFLVRERVLEDDEAEALARVGKGMTLAEVVLAFDTQADPVHRAATSVRRWIGDGLIAGRAEVVVEGGT